MAGRMEDLRKPLGSFLITLAQVNKMDLSGKSDKLGLLVTEVEPQIRNSL